MKYLNVFLLITIAIISNANSFQFSSLEEVQELKTTVFGSNLIETISLTFANGPKADAGRQVLAQLNELKNQLDTDQRNDNLTFDTKSAAFKKHIANLTREIRLLHEEIQRLAAEIARLAVLIAKATKNIASFELRIKNLNVLLEQMALANLEDNKYYNQKISDLGRLYDAFSRIITKLNKLQGSTSGVNKYSHIKATASEQRDAAWRASQDATKPVGPTTRPAGDIRPIEVRPSRQARSIRPIIVNRPTSPAKNIKPIVVRTAKNTKFVEIEEEEKKFMSFLQVENTESTEMKLKMAMEYTNFLQSTVEADQAALKKLVVILSRIQDEQLAKKQATIAHLARINRTYKKIRRATLKEITANRVALKRQTENRAKYMAQKTKAEVLKAQKEARKALLEKEKDINEKLLTSLTTTYQNEKAARAQESKVVAILQRIVERRLLNKN
jgi:hypothetical protein